MVGEIKLFLGAQIDAGWGKGGSTAYRDGRQLDGVRLRRRRWRGGARGRLPGEAGSVDGGSAGSRGDWSWREAGSGGSSACVGRGCLSEGVGIARWVIVKRSARFSHAR